MNIQIAKEENKTKQDVLCDDNSAGALTNVTVTKRQLFPFPAPKTKC